MHSSNTRCLLQKLTKANIASSTFLPSSLPSFYLERKLDLQPRRNKTCAIHMTYDLYPHDPPSREVEVFDSTLAGWPLGRSAGQFREARGRGC